jgi:hypothetical protein
MNDTNTSVQGSGTASDPYIFNFHTVANGVERPFTFWLIVVCVLIGLGYVVFRVLKRKQIKSSPPLDSP